MFGLAAPLSSSMCILGKYKQLVGQSKAGLSHTSSADPPQSLGHLLLLHLLREPPAKVGRTLLLLLLLFARPF
jgi:hypothetical protein